MLVTVEEIHYRKRAQGRCSPGNIFKDYIFEISGFHWSKYTVECGICLTLIVKSAQARRGQAPAHFLSAQMAVHRIFFQVYILLGMYNFDLSLAPYISE